MKTVLLLGANSDVAKACILQYHALGYNIIAASRSTVLLEHFKNDHQLDNLHVIYFDALDYASHPSFYKRLETLPHLVIYAAGYLVNNETAIADFEKAFTMMQTNYCGALSILNIIANDVENAHLERIVGISSLSGVRGRKSNYIYGTTKAAFTHYLEGLRQALAERNILVQVVISGYIRTKINKGLQLNESLLLEPEFVASKIVKAHKGFKIVPGFKWKIIHQIIRFLPEQLLAKLP